MLQKHVKLEFVYAEYMFRAKTICAILNRIPVLYFPRFDFIRLLDRLDSPDFVYFRFLLPDRYIIAFIKKLKKRYPKCKLIIEIPTFPYNRDAYVRWKTFMLFPREVFYRRFYKKYVDRFVTYSRDDEIFGVKTIPVMNGIDTERYKPMPGRTVNDEIRLLAVAFFQRHHGYERVLKGLYQYYADCGKRKIRLIFAGEGTELNKYMRLVKKYHLEDRVSYYGKLVGKKLDAIYDRSDIGLGPFGYYKIGLTEASSLKTREYLSKGLPLAAGCKQDVFPEGSKFFLEFPNNSSPVDVNRIVSFYDRLYGQESEESVAEDIHRIAVEKLSMDVTFKPVIDYLKEK